MSKAALLREEFADWLAHPVTEAVLELLKRRREERRDQWESGQVLELAQDAQMLRNAAAIGECTAYRYLCDLTFEQLQGELSGE